MAAAERDGITMFAALVALVIVVALAAAGFAAFRAFEAPKAWAPEIGARVVVELQAPVCMSEAQLVAAGPEPLSLPRGCHYAGNFLPGVVAAVSGGAVNVKLDNVPGDSWVLREHLRAE